MTTYTATVEFDEAGQVAARRFIESIVAQVKRACDEDGGMHNVGAELLVAYETNQFTIDDLMMRVPQ